MAVFCYQCARELRGRGLVRPGRCEVWLLVVRVCIERERERESIRDRDLRSARRQAEQPPALALPFLCDAWFQSFRVIVLLFLCFHLFLFFEVSG